MNVIATMWLFWVSDCFLTLLSGLKGYMDIDSGWWPHKIFCSWNKWIHLAFHQTAAFIFNLMINVLCICDLHPCICVFMYLCIYVFMYLCISIHQLSFSSQDQSFVFASGKHRVAKCHRFISLKIFAGWGEKFEIYQAIWQNQTCFTNIYISVYKIA